MSMTNKRQAIENAIAYLNQLHRVTDNILYCNFTVQGLKNELSSIELAISELTTLLDEMDEEATCD
jgi:hypothetical protein